MEKGEAPDSIIEETKLSDKQKKFALHYLGECNLNATRAAIAAGYSEKTAAVIGHENLRKPNIRRFIDDRLNSNVLSASEVLSILSVQAKAKIEDVLEEDGSFDFQNAKKRGTVSFVKKLKITERLDAKGNPIERSYDLELHDAQAAAEKVGRFHKLFTDKREVSGSIATYSMTKEEWEREASQKLKQAEAQLEKFDVPETEQDDPDS